MTVFASNRLSEAGMSYQCVCPRCGRARWFRYRRVGLCSKCARFMEQASMRNTGRFR